MAGKLYVFGIGGTGSRVIKALTLLFASGCRLGKGFDVMVPILIDPDTSNGDLNRTKDILRLYQEIRNQVQHPGDFFNQELKTINELANSTSSIKPDYFQFMLEGVDQNTFGEYIGFNTLSEDYRDLKDDKSFIRLLYSEKNINSDLNVGFKGNPNMGSIVLNQFTHSENFQKFGQTFKDGDAIFIINSIFGGTGAAGFPLLLKNLRGNDALPNYTKIKGAKIGGITYLPYFALDKQGEINSESFEEKAKIAIEYYNRTIINQNKINTIYFIGNKGNTKHFEYSVGGESQRNDAHFLELAGALAIFDFIDNIDETTEETQVKEFGIENDTENIIFQDLEEKNRNKIFEPLTKYRLFTEYLSIGLNHALGKSRWTKSNIRLLIKKSKNSTLDKNYFDSPGYNNQIAAFNKHFAEWISEMGENKPAFVPFETITRDDALELVKGISPKGNSSFRDLDIENCKLIDKKEFRSSPENKHTTLLKLFGESTKNILIRKNVLNK